MAKFTAHLYIGPYGEQEKYDSSLNSWGEVEDFVNEKRNGQPWMIILKGGPIVHTIIDSDGAHNEITPREGDDA